MTNIIRIIAVIILLIATHNAYANERLKAHADRYLKQDMAKYSGDLREYMHNAMSQFLDALYKDYPLHLAAMTGDEQSAKELIEGGADVNAKGLVDDYPPIFYAFMGDNFSIVELLLENHADPNIVAENLSVFSWIPKICLRDVENRTDDCLRILKLLKEHRLNFNLHNNVPRGNMPFKLNSSLAISLFELFCYFPDGKDYKRENLYDTEYGREYIGQVIEFIKTTRYMPNEYDILLYEDMTSQEKLQAFDDIEILKYSTQCIKDFKILIIDREAIHDLRRQRRKNDK